MQGDAGKKPPSRPFAVGLMACAAPLRPTVHAADEPLPEPVASVSEASRIEPVPEPPHVEELGADEPRSNALTCGLANPMPGGVTAGYRGDTGLDIAGTPRNVYAIASGTIEYAEAGHTLWNGKNDSKYALRIRLDEPIAYRGRMVTHVWYAHLSELAREVHEGSGETVHVAAGVRLGKSGQANGCQHLHLGLLLDSEVEQYSGTFLAEDEVREVLCAWPASTRLPGDPVSGGA
jgi:murein DD-endopeptidase MepM/ murein hydrolase activator NlpD